MPDKHKIYNQTKINTRKKKLKHTTQTNTNGANKETNKHNSRQINEKKKTAREKLN